MTSALVEEDSATKLKHKLMNDSPAKEETRSFLNFSRENLSISHSDLEQGFNKSRFRPSRNTIVSSTALLIAILCLALETWRLRCSLTNSQEIETLKRDVEGLKHRFVEEDLLDELKSFEKQLYAEEPSDTDDPGEADIDNADYDSNYDYNYEEMSSSHDHSEDYHALPIYGSKPSDFSDLSSTTEATSSSSMNPMLKVFTEFLATLRKTEGKRGQEPEKNARDGHKNSERMESQCKKKSGQKEEKNEGKNEDTDARHRREVSVQERDLRHRGMMNFFRDTKRKRSIEEQSTSSSGIAVYQSAEENQVKENPEMKDGSTLEVPMKYKRKQYSQKLLDTPVESQQQNPTSEISEINPKSKEDSKDKRNLKPSWRPGERKVKSGTSYKPKNSLKPNYRRTLSRRHLRAPTQIYAIHYSADNTSFSHGDEHVGNGRARHRDGIFKAWRESEWANTHNMTEFFTLADGTLTVHEPGLYLVYAQIHYVDGRDENGFHLLVNNNPILQCMVYNYGDGHKSRTCFSAQVTVLRANDRLVLKDVGSPSYTLFHKEKSFFGLVNLGTLGGLRHHVLYERQQIPPKH